jgi:hypothetical protein
MHLATLLSLVLCLATLAMWVRSRWVGDSYYVQAADGIVGFESASGFLCVFREWQLDPASPGFPGYHRTAFSDVTLLDEMGGKDDPRRIRDWRLAGLRFYLSRGGSWEVFDGGYGWGGGYRPICGVLLPYWCPTVLFVLAPARWMWKWRRRRRFSMGFCAACGYDLRASPERCPECGAVLSTRAPAQSPADGSGRRLSRGGCPLWVAR